MDKKTLVSFMSLNIKNSDRNVLMAIYCSIDDDKNYKIIINNICSISNVSRSQVFKSIKQLHCSGYLTKQNNGQISVNSGMIEQNVTTEEFNSYNDHDSNNCESNFDFDFDGDERLIFESKKETVKQIEREFTEESIFETQKLMDYGCECYKNFDFDDEIVCECKKETVKRINYDEVGNNIINSIMLPISIYIDLQYIYYIYIINIINIYCSKPLAAQEHDSTADIVNCQEFEKIKLGEKIPPKSPNPESELTLPEISNLVSDFCSARPESMINRKVSEMYKHWISVGITTDDLVLSLENGNIAYVEQGHSKFSGCETPSSPMWYKNFVTKQLHMKWREKNGKNKKPDWLIEKERHEESLRKSDALLEDLKRRRGIQ